MIDFRSDTVTRPTPGMREAMGRAIVGDDVFGDDPTVNRLQDQAAEMLGFEAALYAPSGTQTNLIALMSQCQRGDEAIVGQNWHTYRWEAGGMAVLGSIQPQPIENQPDGSLRLQDIAAAIKPDDPHFARTRLIALENTTGGKVLPLAYLAEVADLARTRQLVMHLDGARLFNAAVAIAAGGPGGTGVEVAGSRAGRVDEEFTAAGFAAPGIKGAGVTGAGGAAAGGAAAGDTAGQAAASTANGVSADFQNATPHRPLPTYASVIAAARSVCSHFDTVSLCLSKGLGAPVGSLILGSTQTIARAHRIRKMLGGGMRQAGIIAAAGLYALEHHVQRLADDHENARELARGLNRIAASSGPLQHKLAVSEPATNILFVDVDREVSAAFQAYLERSGVAVTGGNYHGGVRQRWVTHLDVDAADVKRALEIVGSFTG